MNKGIKIYIVLLIILLAITLGVYGFFALYGQEYAPVYFMLIPFFYVLDGLSLSITMRQQAEKGERISVKKLMLMRLIRIVGMFLLLILGILLDRAHVVSFVVLFVIYYIVYLIFETIVMKNSLQSGNTKKEI